MNNIKIIFFDIDGTLIDLKKKEASEKTLEALKKLRENGIKICIATGRAPVEIPKFKGVEFDAYLSFNGSYCFDKKRIIVDHSMAAADVQTIIRNAAKFGRPVALSTEDRIEANGKDRDLVEYFAMGKQVIKISEDFEAFSEKKIYQIMTSCRREEYAQMLEGTKNAEITAWWDRAVDIIPTNSGKGVAVSKVLEYYHILPREAMAFGDGNNDMEMLKTVGNGIAMGNASGELKDIADAVCGSVEDEGVYEYCKKLGMIG